MGEGLNSKTIFEYDNFREFLKDQYHSAKIKNKKFSYRYFALKAGFKSQVFLKQVMDGHRNLTPESAEKFAKAFGLNRMETEFFVNLVLFNQAKTSSEKQHYAAEILRTRAYKKIHPLSESQFNFFSKWYFIPIRGMVSLRGFKEDPEWIAQSLVPPITPGEAKRALEDLQKLGLLQRDTQGRLVQASKNVMTPDEVVSSALAQTHRDFMKIAGESIDVFPRAERDISAVTLQVSAERAKKIKEMIQTFRKTIVEEASQDADPERIYQINFQFFPLTKDDEGGAK